MEVGLFAWGSEKAFAKAVTCSNEEQFWKPGRFSREDHFTRF